jgi:Tol biopolymer transport system component
MRCPGSRIAVPILGCCLCAPVFAQVTQRVSVGTSGSEANRDSFAGPLALSADHRFVAFYGASNDLVPGDTNGVEDVFVRDRQGGATERVSVDSAGAQGNAFSGFPTMSADGRFVAFLSFATNLVAGDTNGSYDVFVRDRQAGTTERVSVDSAGVEGNDNSYFASISADGRFVAFVSHATNLVPGDTNGAADIFVRDRQGGTTERVSLDSSGVEGNGPSDFPSISADGRYVVFLSRSTNLVAGGTSGLSLVFVHDRQTGATACSSVDAGGAPANGDSSTCSISADGRFVGFDSSGTNLVSGDTNGVSDVFLHDVQGGSTERMSVDSSGVQGDGASSTVSFSADGRLAVFMSLATNLVPGDTNGAADTFVRDRTSGRTSRVSIDSSGGQANGDSYNPSMSSDGRYVVFDSHASDLVPGDTNSASDVFVGDSRGGPAFARLCDPGVGGVIACPCANPPGGPGRGCDNSSATGGASLSASGGSILSSDSLVFRSEDERPTAFSVLLQGTARLPNGQTYGQGVRCVGGTLKRLFAKIAVAGSVTVPDFAAGEPTVSARSAALGDVIQPGESRYYLVFYRDPTVLDGCPASSTFNATQTGRVDWSP